MGIHSRVLAGISSRAGPPLGGSYGVGRDAVVVLTLPEMGHCVERRASRRS